MIRKKRDQKFPAAGNKTKTSFKYCIFEVEWGRCALVWSDKGVRGFYLPGLSLSKLEASIRKNFPDAARAEPGAIARTVRLVQDYFSGKKVVFAAPLDLSWASPFSQSVYKALQKIPYGQTRSYADIARAIGKPGASRAVGQANGANNIPLLIPCHRVISASGSLGGFSGPGGTLTKKRMLDLEKKL